MTEHSWGTQSLQARIDELYRIYQPIPVQSTLFRTTAHVLMSFGGTVDPLTMTVPQAQDIKKLLFAKRNDADALTAFLAHNIKEVIIYRGGRVPRRISNRLDTYERDIIEGGGLQIPPYILMAYMLMIMFDRPLGGLRKKETLVRHHERSPLMSPTKAVPGMIRSFVDTCSVEELAFFEAMLIYHGLTPPTASQSALGDYMRGDNTPWKRFFGQKSTMLTTHLLPLVRFTRSKHRTHLSSVHQRVRQYSDAYEGILKAVPHPTNEPVPTLLRVASDIEMAEASGREVVTQGASGYLGTAGVLMDLEAAVGPDMVQQVIDRLTALPVGAQVDLAALVTFTNKVESLLKAGQHPFFLDVYDDLLVAMVPFTNMEARIVYTDATPMRLAKYAVKLGRRLTGAKQSWLDFIANDHRAYHYYMAYLSPDADPNDTQGMFYKYLKDVAHREDYQTEGALASYNWMIGTISARSQEQVT